ncbi:unnamed protein product [Pelagomonas calceolata]|uniref:RING-CH-type domain-containing protein n=2 Tax=Pelagomonas calceolata TaxID=35677 RepID=A0A8J2S5U1_9STRA|nr:unnamed protein product [Pelagomonas calceolata]
MILTLCTACAAPLPDEPMQCAECATRYCSERCERYDRRRGGHGRICGAIASGGGAEQYHADKKYAEAVDVAVEECAEDAEGQTCYICTEALHAETKEGLVRGCACRGTAGFAHVSCLAEQAKILVAEGEENNLGLSALNDRWARWDTCSLCKQMYYGVVYCALGWACWKTYVGRPETDRYRRTAMGVLGNGLEFAERNDEALPIKEAELSMERRLGASEDSILVVQGNLANTYAKAGRSEDAVCTSRDVYLGHLKLYGEENEKTLRATNNYASILVDLRHFKEAQSLMRKTIPVARRVLEESNETTLRMRWTYAMALFFEDSTATLDDLSEAVTTLEDIEQIARRVFGGAHPTTSAIEENLQDARAVLHAREETPSPGNASSS